MYPTTIGSHHMRSTLLKTRRRRSLEELRKAGYFVAWPGKTDFNFDRAQGGVRLDRELDDQGAN